MRGNAFRQFIGWERPVSRVIRTLIPIIAFALLLAALLLSHVTDRYYITDIAIPGSLFFGAVGGIGLNFFAVGHAKRRDRGWARRFWLPLFLSVPAWSLFFFAVAVSNNTREVYIEFLMFITRDLTIVTDLFDYFDIPLCVTA